MMNPRCTKPVASAVSLLAAAAFCLLGSRPILPQSPAPKIDGQTDDWRGEKFTRDVKSGAEMAFRNDRRNLYVLFVVKDAKPRESLDSTGLVVLAGKKTAKKPDRGVLFLKRQVPAESYILWQESQGLFLSDQEKDKLRDMIQRDLCLTFAVGALGSVYGPLRQLDRENIPPSFAAAESPEGITYELKIPLAEPAIVPGGLGLAPGETVRISFSWGGATRKILSTKATRATPPSEQGGLSGVASPAQEFLNMFDALSRPTMGTKKFSFAVDVRLAEIQ
jgi:hypothetical protein